MSAPVADRTTASDAPSIPADQLPRPGSTGFNGIRRVPIPINEPVRSYAPGSPEKTSLKARLESMATERIEIPILIGGEEFRTGELAQAVMPHDHQHVLADFHKAQPKHVEMAIA